MHRGKEKRKNEKPVNQQEKKQENYGHTIMYNRTRSVGWLVDWMVGGLAQNDKRNYNHHGRECLIPVVYVV